MPWESVIEEKALAWKSKPTTMRSPATVFLGKATEKVLAVPGAAPAVTCTREIPVDVADVTVRVRVALPVPLLFAAFSVTAEVPAMVGVPEINPVAVFTDKPAGRSGAGDRWNMTTYCV